MIFAIARDLNEPFGFDVHDVKLNAISIKSVKKILNAFLESKIYLPEVVIPEHQTPAWLENSTPEKLEYNFQPEKASFRLRPIRAKITCWLIVLALWTSVVVISTWYVTRNDPRGVGVRWWTLYMPLTTSTISFVSVGLFLLVGFWINDAYSRYWDGLQIWQSTIKPNLENVAVHFAIMNERDTWHQRDRERIFSFISAVPYVAKMSMRRDFSSVDDELGGILCADDIQSLKEVVDPMYYVFNILYGYVHCANRTPHTSLCKLKVSPNSDAAFSFLYSLWDVEKGINLCLASQVYPISVAFTLHLRLFTAFWLALLPLSLVIFGGFTSFAYIVPLGYAVINLLILGDELCDPFGEDPHDIPLERFCKEISQSLHRIYYDTSVLHDIILPRVTYDRGSFKSKYSTDGLGVDWDSTDLSGDEEKQGEEEISLRGIFQQIIDFLPKVSALAMVATIVWTVAATFLSWQLSRMWHDDLNDGNYSNWQSPVDVDSSVTGSVGFALFLILSFACSDGISRYESAGRLLYDLEKHLTSVVSLIIKNMKDDSFHVYDKERMVAHILQIPILLRNILLEKPDQDTESFLCETDYKNYINSPSSLEHLISTVHAYAISHDMILTSSMEIPTKRAMTEGELDVVNYSSRFHTIRLLLNQALSVKRFPIVGSYKVNQRIFIGIWLAILPFTMTSHTGFFTILWVPLIAYGIYGMQEISERLADPLGEDKIDVPVNKICKRTVDSILAVVNTSKWGWQYHIKEMSHSLFDTTSSSSKDGQMMSHSEQKLKVHAKEEAVTIPLSYRDMGETVKNNDTTEPIKTRSLFSHMIRSVPWWQILGVTVWTAMACILSYVLRRRNPDLVTRWWISYITIDSSVVSYMSTATFSLLGFYVNAAYARYLNAGSIWTERLRAACHNMARSFLVSSDYNSVHTKDHDRILGHIIAIPLVMKEQLKNTNDLRSLHKYLSHEDIGRIEVSDDMITHCCEVLRSYHMEINCHNKNYTDLSPATLSKVLQGPILELENCISELKYLNEFFIPTGFLNLLDVLLLTWFICLPFAIIGNSGWFTILWITFISYSVLGIHSIAVEIQHPFGTDLNDFNLDKMTHRIVEDVVHIKNSIKHSQLNARMYLRPVPSFFDTYNFEKAGGKKSDESSETNNIFLEKIRSMKQSVQLSLHIMNWWTALVYLIWVSLSVCLSYAVHRFWPFSDELKKSCSIWFCSRITVSSSVLNYIGFALFLLLGFQIYDSHGRYIQGIDIWQESVMRLVRIITNRVLDTMPMADIHENDIQRLVGHLAAFPIVLMGTLRGEEYKEKLLQILDYEDVNAILAAPEKADYCFDVIWSYTVQSFRVENSSVIEKIFLFNLVKPLHSVILDCQHIIKTPMPYGYNQHLKIFIAIYLMLLPFGLVESSGLITILWCMFIAYGTYGAERWSSELANPFGHDLSDIPLDKLCDSILLTMKDIYDLYKDNLNSTSSRFNSIILSDRLPSLHPSPKVETSS